METAITILCAAVIMQGVFLIYIGLEIIKAKHIDEPIKPPSKPLFKPKEPNPTAEETREKAIMENLEAYDGTGKGQVKV